jgi:hypothetical protein
MRVKHTLYFNEDSLLLKEIVTQLKEKHVKGRNMNKRLIQLIELGIYAEQNLGLVVKPNDRMLASHKPQKNNFDISTHNQSAGPSDWLSPLNQAFPVKTERTTEDKPKETIPTQISDDVRQRLKKLSL